MKSKTIKKSIDINAPKEKVWDVLLNDKYTRIWYAEFSEGSHAETDWKLGSKAVFTDGSGCGMVGRIVENKPAEVISVEYEGTIINGVEDYESEMSKAVKGTRETYKLSEKNGVTHLDISCEMGEEYFDMMSAAWDRALQKIKGFAEQPVAVA